MGAQERKEGKKWDPEMTKRKKRKGGRSYKKKKQPSCQPAGLQNHTRRQAKRRKGAVPSSAKIKDNEAAWNAMLSKLPVIEGSVLKYHIPPGKDYPEMMLDADGKSIHSFVPLLSAFC